MSAPAPAPAEGEAPPKKSKLKLIIIAVAVLVLAGGGGGAFLLMGKKKPAEEEEVAAPKLAPPKNPPVFMAMDNLVVNLSDTSGDRMVQLGITIQVQDQKTADLVKLYMPIIRGKVLMLVSQHTSAQLLQREGKEKLASAIHREVGLPLGIVPDEEEDEEEDPKPKKKKKKKAPAPPNPVQAVLFTSFIIQ